MQALSRQSGGADGRGLRLAALRALLGGRICCGAARRVVDTEAPACLVRGGDGGAGGVPQQEGEPFALLKAALRLWPCDGEGLSIVLLAASDWPDGFRAPLKPVFPALEDGALLAWLKSRGTRPSGPAASTNARSRSSCGARQAAMRSRCSRSGWTRSRCSELQAALVFLSLPRGAPLLLVTCAESNTSWGGSKATHTREEGLRRHSAQQAAARPAPRT